MDTVALAKQVREKQGPWEAEVSYGGEEALHQHLNDCDKHPGHQKFIPVDQFNIERLPLGYRDEVLVDYVQGLVDVTVRVSVKYVSDRRPQTVPRSDKPYPSYKDRDKDRYMMRTGTGSLYMVTKYPNKKNSSTTCECQECRNSPTRKTQFAKIYIQTAAHVVYDEQETAYTTCHLFFDNGGSPKDCSGVLQLSGWYFVGKGKVGDWTDIVHMTHDLDLADQLLKMVDRWDKVWKKVDNKYPALKSREQKSSSPSEYLAEALENVDNNYPGMKSGEQESLSPSEHLPEALEKVDNKYPGLKSWEQESSSPSEYLAEALEKVDNKYPGLKSGEQESSSPSEHLTEAWEKVFKGYERLVSGEQESSSPSDYLLEVREMVNNKCRGLEPGEQDSSSPSEYLHETLEKVDNKYRGLEPGVQESSSPSERLSEASEKVDNKYRGLESGEQDSSSPSDYLPAVREKLTIIVSHPHGCSKQISFGYCTGTDRDKGDLPTWTRYTTPTCPGSSGANVFVLADDGGDRIHCGNCEDDKELNFGAFCWT